MSTHRIAVIPGDGIGKEVMPEGLRALDAAARRFGIDLSLDHFDFASCPWRNCVFWIFWNGTATRNACKLND